MPKTITHPMGYSCHLIKDRYADGGRTCLKLVAADNTDDCIAGEPIGVATVNIPEIPLESGEILVKNYSENEGLLQALESAGIVRSTGKVIPTGFVYVHVCALDDAVLSEYLVPAS